MNNDKLLEEKCNKISQYARLCKPMYNVAEKKNTINIDRLISIAEIIINIIISDQFKTIIKIIINQLLNLIH